ncbi:MAG: hypothetical protein FWJ93_12625 [Micromonosporaceae bacterium]
MTGIRRHRAPDRPAARALAALGSRLGIGALLIAAIAVGSLIKSVTPDTDTRERPFIRTGAPGEATDARTFEVRVLEVRGAKKIVRLGRERETGGVWVLVKVQAVARHEPTTIGYAAVRDARGRLFHATERIAQPLLGGRTLQPGVPVEGEIVFEVPADAAVSLSIRLAWTPLDQRMDAMAEIGLDIDAASVAAWQAATEAARITDAKLAIGPDGQVTG